MLQGRKIRPFFIIMHIGLCVFASDQGARPGDMYTFFEVALLMGGRTPDQDA